MGQNMEKTSTTRRPIMDLHFEHIVAILSFANKTELIEIGLLVKSQLAEMELNQ